MGRRSLWTLWTARRASAPRADRARPEAVEAWAGRFVGGELRVAVEACTGGLFVYEALAAAGAVGHLAEPVETNALGGKKRRAKTDRADAVWLRTLLCQGRLAEAWIPPAHVRGWGTRARFGKTPVDERPAWLRRVPATLFHRGVAGVPDKLLGAQAATPRPARAACGCARADRGGAFR